MKSIYLFIILVINGSALVSSESHHRMHHDHDPSQGFCDDGKTDLEVDWNGDPVNYTCYSKERIPRMNIPNIDECEQVSPSYVPGHFCMKTKIHYAEAVPTHAGHRPVWAKYGEYGFVPVHRWAHNVEHGAIIMLYHPCANLKEVSILRELVVNCVRKHIITPYNLMPIERPLALVSWGCRLMMSSVDENAVISFIMKRALKAPEGKLMKDGKFDKLLIQPARIPPGSDYLDSVICAQYQKKGF